MNGATSRRDGPFAVATDRSSGAGEPRTRPAVVFALCCAVVLAVQFALLYRYPVDDAYISFRYALNLKLGRGPVFNPGERVEGFSNPLWTLLLAPVAERAEAAALGLAFLSHLALCFAVFRVARSLGTRPWLAGLSCAAFPPLVVQLTSGLETLLFAALIAGAMLALIERRHAWLHAASAALILCRPDGALPVAWLYACALSLPDFRREGMRRPSVPLPLLALVALFGFRRYYYGEWLPNTFYAKHGALGPDILLGLRYAGTFYLAFPPLLLGLVPTRRHVLLPGFGLLWTAYVIAVGGDWMEAHRFLAPVAPVLLLSALRLLETKSGDRPSRRAPAAVLLFALAFGLSLGASEYRLIKNRDQFTGLDLRLRFFSDRFSQLTGARPGDSVAISTIGYFGYRNIDLKVLDLLGLTDRHIARTAPRLDRIRLPGHEKFDNRYVLARRPDFFVTRQPFFRNRPDGLTIRAESLHVVERDMVEQPEFARNYALTAAKIADGLWVLYWRRTPSEGPPREDRPGAAD